MGKFLRLAAMIGFAALLTSGCAVNRATGSVEANTDLSSLKRMYVKKLPDESGGTNELIAEKLRSKGVTVATGTEATPPGYDAIVNYTDKWMWDMTMYMIELTIIIRDPESGFPLAKGNSFHTSLTRLSPKEMVNEVIDNIYKGAKQ